MIKTTIGYRPRDTSAEACLRDHPDCRLLYAEMDTVTSLDLCPFPLQTDTLKVLLFGDYDNPHAKSARHECCYGKWAVVEYIKSCGHTVQERISFFEDVKTFEHYGTVFEGSSYSINDWERRIEFFRNQLPCAVCSLVAHSLWCLDQLGGGVKKALKGCLEQLEYNYDNWRDFIAEEEVRARFYPLKQKRNQKERNDEDSNEGQ